MREVVKRFNVYTYSELSDQAKAKAKRDYLDDDLRNEDFCDMCQEDLWNLFPNSSLKFQYSLGHCQGDGFNVYGTAALCDLQTISKNAPAYQEMNQFSEEEWKHLFWCYDNRPSEIELPLNRRYAYCKADTIEFAEEWIDELEDFHDYNKEDEILLCCFEQAVRNLFSHHCNDQEEAGYNYLYDISSEEMQDLSDANDWEYYEDGRLYG